MSNENEHAGRGPLHVTVESWTAVGMAVFGLIVITGSLQVGIGWGAEGPRSGFFPFYIGTAIVLSSVVNFITARREHDGKLFAEWSQLRQVMSVVIPTTIYVLVIPFIGMYLASFVLIAGFMIWLGRYSVLFSVGIAAAVMVGVYFTFERWFLVPLPKGPIEMWLGL